MNGFADSVSLFRELLLLVRILQGSGEAVTVPQLCQLYVFPGAALGSAPGTWSGLARAALPGPCPR